RVREAIEVLEELGAHLFRAGERPHAPLGAPGNGACDVAGGCRGAASREDELLEGRQGVVEAIELLLEPRDLGSPDHAMARDAELAAHVEELMLRSEERRVGKECRGGGWGGG